MAKGKSSSRMSFGSSKSETVKGNRSLEELFDRFDDLQKELVQTTKETKEYGEIQKKISKLNREIGLKSLKNRNNATVISVPYNQYKATLLREQIRTEKKKQKELNKFISRTYDFSKEARQGFSQLFGPLDNLLGGLLSDITGAISETKNVITGAYKVFKGTKDLFFNWRKNKQYDVQRNTLEEIKTLARNAGVTPGRIGEVEKRLRELGQQLQESGVSENEIIEKLTESYAKETKDLYNATMEASVNQYNEISDKRSKEGRLYNQLIIKSIEKLNKTVEKANKIGGGVSTKTKTEESFKQYARSKKQKYPERRNTKPVISSLPPSLPYERYGENGEIITEPATAKLNEKQAKKLTNEILKVKKKGLGTAKEDKGPTEAGAWDIPEFFSAFERGSTAGPIERLYVKTKEFIIEGGKQGIGGFGQPTEKKSSIKSILKPTGKKEGEEGSLTDTLTNAVTQVIAEKIFGKFGGKFGKIFGKGGLGNIGRMLGGRALGLAGGAAGVAAAGYGGYKFGSWVNKNAVDPIVQSMTNSWEKERVSKEDAEMNAKVADLKRRRDENILRKKQETITDKNIKKEINLAEIKEDIQTEDKKQLKQMKEVSEDGFFAKLLKGVFGGGGGPAPAPNQPPQTGPSAVQGGEGKVSLSGVEEAQYIAKQKGKGISFKGGKGLTQEQKAKIAAAGAQYGVDPKALEAIAMMESGGNPNAVSKTGAVGMYQFTKGTAEEMGLTNRYDESANIIAGARLYAKNREQLRKKLKREPTANEIYLAHQQGAGGAAQIIRASETGNENLISSNVRRNMNLNNGIGLTSKQFIDLQSSKLASAATKTGTIAPTQVAKTELQKTPVNETAKVIKKVETKNAKIEAANREKLANVMTESKDAISNIKPEGNKTVVMNNNNQSGQFIDSDKIFSMIGLVYG